MKISIKLFLISVFSLGFLSLSSVLSADSLNPPSDYKKVTENNKYVLVMLVSNKPEESPSGVKRSYKQSGLYRNDGSKTPLWTIDWYANDVIPSSDGMHLIRMGPWAWSPDQLALSFHKNGKEIKAYKIKELVDSSKLKHTISHFFWKSDLYYDDKNGVLQIKTVENNLIKFDAKTGERLQ